MKRIGFPLKALLTGLALLLGSAVLGQQDAQYTQYMYNTVSVNPAYAGSRGHFSVAALYRAQWVGLDGAPETQTLNLHSPMGYKGFGTGLSFVNEKIGPTSETYFDIDVSYTIQTGLESRLSFGIKAGAHLLDVRFSELNQNMGQGTDPTLQDNIDNRFSPNVGAGIYFHTDTYYAGLSIPRMLETTHFEESSLSTATELINWYFITGYVFDLTPDLKFKPSLLTKAVRGAPLQVDVSANFMFAEKFTGGIAYRWDAAFSGLIGFQLSREFLVGLAYDREITDLGATSFNNGSFEVILRYDFVKSADYIKSPRFF